MFNNKMKSFFHLLTLIFAHLFKYSELFAESLVKYDIALKSVDSEIWFSNDNFL